MALSMALSRLPLLLLLAAAAPARTRAGEPPPRLVIVNGSFVRSSDGARVVPLGGNYIVKAQPYFPERHVVERNARALAEGAARMAFRPSDGRVVVPVVRLGVLFEGAMPSQAGVFDPTWMAKLEDTVQAFADAGVYVFLDIHQDALAASSGGEGFPVWMTEMMQETAGEVPDCSTCHARNSYITSPEHPLACSLYELRPLLRRLGFDLPVPKIANSTDPWRAYSVGGGAGDPRRMNVGNINMRINNCDAAWSSGVLVMSQQVQNVAWRLYRSPKYPAEKAMFFDPYVAFVKHLCRVWAQHSNVIAVELLNEPPVGGLPDLHAARGVRSDLFDFYAAVTRALDADSSVPRAPLAVEDITGNSGQVALTLALLDAIGIESVISKDSIQALSRYASTGRLVLSFHWYPPFNSDDSMATWISSARRLAEVIGGTPIYMSEYFSHARNDVAREMAEAVEKGCDAVTYWHYADIDYTGTDGWFIGPDFVGEDFRIDWNSWAAYEPTVANGTYWGASITGAHCAKMDVLPHVPQVKASFVAPAETELLWMRRPTTLVV